jgi:hypothetical protein
MYIKQYIVVNVGHIWLYECAVNVMRKELKLLSEGSDSGTKKCKWGNDGTYGGVW